MYLQLIYLKYIILSCWHSRTFFNNWKVTFLWLTTHCCRMSSAKKWCCAYFGSACSWRWVASWGNATAQEGWSNDLTSKCWNVKTWACVGLCTGNSMFVFIFIKRSLWKEGGEGFALFFAMVLFYHIGILVKIVSPCSPVHLLVLLNYECLNKGRSLNLTGNPWIILGPSQIKMNMLH